MPGPVVATHDIDVGEREVVKRFRSWARGEHRREWRALTMLAVYAPGLAAAPVSCDLDSEPPHVRMSRVPGGPLAARAVTVAVARRRSDQPAGVVYGCRGVPRRRPCGGARGV